MSSIKSMMGHLIAAAGSVEFITCVLAIRDGIVLWFGHPELAKDPFAQILAGTWSPESVRQEFVTNALVARAKNETTNLQKQCEADGQWARMVLFLESMARQIPVLDVARARRDCLTTDSLGLPSEGGGVLAHSQRVEQPAQNWSGQAQTHRFGGRWRARAIVSDLTRPGPGANRTRFR